MFRYTCFFYVLLLCRNSFSQPTVFTKQWNRDTKCIIDENDIVSTLEFILVDLQRLRFDAKQLKDASESAKKNFAKIETEMSDIIKQNKRLSVAVNRFGNKLLDAKINIGDVKDTIKDVNRTLSGLIQCKYHFTTTISPRSSQEFNSIVIHKDEKTNEIKVDHPVEENYNTDNNIYFEEETKRENEVNALVSNTENYNLQESDQESEEEIDTFSGQNKSLASDVGDIYSGNDLYNLMPEKPPISPGSTSDPQETSINDQPNTLQSNTLTTARYNTVPDNSIAADNSNRRQLSEVEGIDGVLTRQDPVTDCSEITSSASGVYIISPTGTNLTFPVYCQFQDNSRWLVFQRRLNGVVDFYRDWDDYKTGFGDLGGEFWLGNEKLHLITAHNKYMLRIDMWDWDLLGDGDGFGSHFYAESSYFYIDNETEFYRMHVPNGFYDYSGFGGSGLRVHAGPFMTYDKRHPDLRTNCAQVFHTGWWFKTCVQNANLNGRYYESGYVVPENRTRAQDGIFWRNIPRSLKKVEMKLRRV